MNLGTASIDLGTWSQLHDEQGGDLGEFLKRELADVIGTSTEHKQTDVVLYGFGRIGRLLARILIDHQSVDTGCRLRAIVVRKNGENDLTKRASLLRRDSVHGPFHGSISIDHDNDILWANGTPIQIIYSNDPCYR